MDESDGGARSDVCQAGLLLRKDLLMNLLKYSMCAWMPRDIGFCKKNRNTIVEKQ